MVVELGPNNHIVAHLLLVCHRAFLWIYKSSRATADGCWNLLLMLIGARTCIFSPEQRRRNGVDGLLLKLLLIM